MVESIFSPHHTDRARGKVPKTHIKTIHNQQISQTSIRLEPAVIDCHRDLPSYNTFTTLAYTNSQVGICGPYKHLFLAGIELSTRSAGVDHSASCLDYNSYVPPAPIRSSRYLSSFTKIASL